MAVELNFYLSDEDMERLWAIKKQKGENDLTGNEFAAKLLTTMLHQLHPEKVEVVDE